MIDLGAQASLNHYNLLIVFIYIYLYFLQGIKDGLLPPKYRGGILVARTDMQRSTYSWNIQSPEKISICLIRGRIESLDNDDVSIVHARK